VLTVYCVSVLCLCKLSTCICACLYLVPKCNRASCMLCTYNPPVCLVCVHVTATVWCLCTACYNLIYVTPLIFSCNSLARAIVFYNPIARLTSPDLVVLFTGRRDLASISPHSSTDKSRDSYY